MIWWKASEQWQERQVSLGSPEHTSPPAFQQDWIKFRIFFMGLLAIFKLSFFIMSQIIFLSIIHWLFSEMHLHQMVLNGSCRPLLGKAAWSERLPSPSACTALFLILTPYIYFFKHLNSEFWSFSLETLPFWHLSRFRLQISISGLQSLCLLKGGPALWNIGWVSCALPESLQGFPSLRERWWKGCVHSRSPSLALLSCDSGTVAFQVYDTRH